MMIIIIGMAHKFSGWGAVEASDESQDKSRHVVPEFLSISRVILLLLLHSPLLCERRGVEKVGDRCGGAGDMQLGRGVGGDDPLGGNSSVASSRSHLQAAIYYRPLLILIILVIIFVIIDCHTRISFFFFSVIINNFDGEEADEEGECVDGLLLCAGNRVIDFSAQECFSSPCIYK